MLFIPIYFCAQNVACQSTKMGGKGENSWGPQTSNSRDHKCHFYSQPGISHIAWPRHKETKSEELERLGQHSWCIIFLFYSWDNENLSNKGHSYSSNRVRIWTKACVLNLSTTNPRGIWRNLGECLDMCKMWNQGSSRSHLVLKDTRNPS